VTELGRAVRNSKVQLLTFYDLCPIFMGKSLYFVMRSASQLQSRDSSMLWYFELFTIQ